MTHTDTAVDTPLHLRSLDPSLYDLSEEESTFFKHQTGIQDDEELKAHILDIQASNRACVGPSVSMHPSLRVDKPEDLETVPLQGPAQTGCGARRGDISCLTVGDDLRKAIADGYPKENVVATDLHQDFWSLGHELFKTTPEAFPVPFVAGNAFDAACIEFVPPFTKTSPLATPRPNLTTLTTLNPLRGHVSAIHASAFFHLFNEEGQLHLARAMAGLLSPEPGSMIFGQHGALPEKGFRPPSKGIERTMFCHGPDSWQELWDGGVFEKGSVKVETKLEEASATTMQAFEMREGTKFWWLIWKVTRL